MARRPLSPRESSKAHSLPPRRLAAALLITSLAGSLGGCGTIAKDLYDYVNPGNSFLDPSQVGRFDRDNPFGDVRPVKWPILEQLDVVDEPIDRWSSATDPTPADLVAQNKEYTLGPGDILRISVYELVQPNTEYLKDQAQVSESGTVSIQNLGAVQVAGLTAREAEEKIGQIAVERNLLLPKGNGSQGPQVSITLEQSQSRQFTILGNVQQPSTYNIIGTDFRLLNALGLARDIQGGSQPGLDYIYVIRRTGPKPPLADSSSSASPAAPDNGTAAPITPAAPVGNPLDALDSLQKPTTVPTTPASEPAAPPPALPATEPSTAPATNPGTTGPVFVRPLPTAVVVSSGESTSPQLAQADLDAAISGTTTTQPAVTAAPTPAATIPATAATAPNDELLNQAMGSTTKPGQNVYIDGKWVTMPQTAPGTPAVTDAGATSMPMTPQTPMAPATMAGPMSGSDTFAAADQMIGQRVIRIPLNPLREGNPKYNIVIQPGDIIVVPTVEQGYFYMMGHVSRPGVYTLTGQKITLKMAVAAAGNLDAVAIPRRCDLIRRIGQNQEVTVQVNLQAVFDGTQPDIFLKPNDLVNIGTDFVAPFLAVTRNGYRASYGFGFIYDRNYYITPTIVQ
jgi:protein involved in polysaccharide export with SLBB domain